MINKLREALGKLLQILNRPQKRLFVVVFLCSMLAAILETIGVSVIIPLVNVLLQPEIMWEKIYIQQAAKLLHISSNNQLIVYVIVFVIIVYILKNLFFIFNSWLKVKYACKIKREISVDMMKSYMNRGYRYFLLHNYNEINQGVNGDILNLFNVILHVLQAMSQMSIVVFIGIFLSIADWQLALGVVVAAIVCLFLIFVFFRQQLLNAGELYRQYTIRANKIFQEAIHGIKEVFVLRKQKFFISEFEEATKVQQNALVSQTVGSEIPAYIIEGISIASIMIILGIRIIGMENPQSLMAVLASFGVGAFRILPAVGKMSTSVNVISSCVPSLDAIYENLIESKKTLRDFDSVEVVDKITECNLFNNKISIRDISFSYDGEKKILKDLSLDICKGMAVAFVGESGAGKSTLADVLLGILEPQEGGIYLDKTDIRDIPNKWSKMVGFVPQSIYLVDTTIRENIAFGVAEQDIDDARIKKVLAQANLLEYIDSMEKGIYTEVGDRGVRLSGGQKQRIGIARALYHKPELLVLDEATSALDNETEVAVMEAIDSLQGTVTMVIIAHRLTTIKNCDKIYEILDGKAYERKYGDLV